MKDGVSGEYIPAIRFGWPVSENPHIATNWVVRPGRAPGNPGVYGFITVMCSSEASAVLVREPAAGVWFLSTMSEYRPG
jgi:hypothetical protein